MQLFSQPVHGDHAVIGKGVSATRELKAIDSLNQIEQRFRLMLTMIVSRPEREARRGALGNGLEPDADLCVVQPSPSKKLGEGAGV